MRKLCCANRNFTTALLIIYCTFPLSCLSAEGWIPPSPGKSNKDGAKPNAAKFKERLLLVDIDQQQLNQTVLVLEDKLGELYLWGHDLQRWRFLPPDESTSVKYQGENYYPLSAISGISHLYDRQKLTLAIKVSPEAFETTSRLASTANSSPPVKASPGGFFNYDLLAYDSPDTSQRAGQFELGYFNRYGVGTNTALAERLDNNSRMTRLDSIWISDFQDRMQTLHIGDAISIPGTWGSSLRFAGVQFGTNFGTQPGFIMSPPQSIVGQAVMPSTVDVFINNALASHQSVPPGPFAISNLPVITGAGEVRLVVRDLLGREQVINRKLYGSQVLLSSGLENFSFELGSVRENYGISSNDYGNWLGSGTYRRGMSDHFTGEVHAETMARQVTIGGGSDTLLPQFGTINSYIAASQNSAEHGLMILFGFDRLAQPWSLGARSQWATPGYSQLGYAASQLPPAQLSSASLSYALRSGGSIAAAYVSQRNRAQADMRVATLSYSMSLGNSSTLNISAMQNLDIKESTSCFAMLSIALDSSTSMLVSSQSMPAGNEITSTLQRNLPPGAGYGYRLQGRSDGASELSYSLQNNVVTYAIDAAQNEGVTATRLNATGGIATLGGDLFLSRTIDQSFAVVRIPDYPNVSVLTDNQAAGRTNADGNALIPRLRAYDHNIISIDQRDLPLDAEINTLKLDAIPAFRSGTEVKFPIKHSRGATLSIKLENGKPLPVGASVQEAGKTEVFVTGYGGEVYVLGLNQTTTLQATWGNHHCRFEVTFAATVNPLPDLGVFVCKGVKP